jgi:hypothetical protein
MWGWLQVSKRLNLLTVEGMKEAKGEAPSHPHVAHPNGRSNNFLYLGTGSLSFNERVSRAGAFDTFRPNLQLTDEQSAIAQASGRIRTLWCMPAFFRGISMTRIDFGDREHWRDQNGRIVGRAADTYGQEYVLKTEKRKKEIAGWLDGIFKEM